MTGAPKFVTGAQIHDNKKEIYDAVRIAVGSKERIRPACTVTVFSAAMDNQTTPAGNPLSPFTYNISRSWVLGAFPGGYS